MAKLIKFLALVATTLLIFSFTNKNTIEFTGTYGVSPSDPAQIKLTINPDHTFTYQDLSVSGNKIVAKGNWRLKGKKVVLNNHDSQTKFHDVWTFDQNGQVAKSRKGLTFYRLCKIDG